MSNAGVARPSEPAALRLIPIHKALASLFVWIPVFVLYTQRQFGLDGAVLLSGLYYLAVVVLEVPSGWMSDRWGRARTLRVAAVGFTAAHLCFLIGEGRFAVIVLGQVMLAVGFASLSGTDVAYHYDVLDALGRSDEFARRQARVSALGYGATALSALVGGLLGWGDLRWALWASLVAGLAQLSVTFLMVDPPRTDHVEASGLVDELRAVISYLGRRRLRWLFGYGVALVTLEHVAFTLMQPWLVLVLDRDLDDVGAAPLVAGIVFAAVSVVGAVAARSSEPLGRRLGLVPALLVLAAVSALVVTVMASTTAPLAVVVVLFRSVQGAAAPVLLAAAIAPVTAARHRATYLSLNSLGGRLGYGGLLVALSPWAEETARTLVLLAGLSWVLVAVLTATARDRA